MNSLSKNRNSIYIKFFFAFFALLPFCFMAFALEKSSFFVYDGITQHVNALAYIGKYFRSLFAGFIHLNFEIPQWDFNLGLGADILTTLHYYSFGDPIDLISIFCPVKYIQQLYIALIFFRIMLAGVAFIIYARRHSCSEYGTLLGSLIYAFSGYVLFCSVRHPYFINPMIYLPLLCLGVDKVFNKENSLFLSIVTFLACISNFYFFYMLSIITVAYAMILFCARVRNFKLFPSYFLRTFIPFCLGFLVACPIFLPQINTFFNSGRVEDTGELLSLIYRPQYYVKMIMSLCAPSTFGSYSTLGFAAPVFLLFIALWSNKKDSLKIYKVVFICIFVMLLFPIFGCIFNGFNYVTNRWCFSVAFAFSFMVAKKSEFLLQNKKQLALASIFSLVFSSIVFALSVFSKDVREQFFICYIVLAIYSLLIFIKRNDVNSLKLITLIFTIISLIVNANVRYSKWGLDYLKNFQKTEDVEKKLQELVTEFPIKQKSNEFFRIETENLQLINSPCVAGYHGTTYYWSINNENLYSLYKYKSLKGNALSLSGFENQEDLYALFNVKYSLEKSGSLKNGFIDTGLKYLDYEIHENTNFVPFGFVVNKTNLPLFENCKIEELKNNEALKIDRITANKIVGEVNVRDDSVMIFSIPYSSGWKARVDGNETPLLKTDYAFTALNLNSGTHSIVLSYETSFLKLGIMLCLLGILGMITNHVLTKRSYLQKQ